MAWYEDLIETLLIKVDSESAGRSIAAGAVAAIGESLSSNFAMFAAEGVLPGLDPTTVAGLVAFGAFPFFRRHAVKRAAKAEVDFISKFRQNPDQFLDALEDVVEPGAKASVVKIRKQLSGNSIQVDVAYRALRVLLLKHYVVQ